MRPLLLILAITFSTIVSAQVGIGVNYANVDPSAQLEVSSTSKGFLVPRMTSSQRTGISNPANGLLVYQTDAPIGFYYFSQGKWKLLGEQDITMKLSISDTASMLSGYAGVQRMLDSLFAVQTRLNQKLNTSDTVLMLSGYAKASSLLDSIASVQSNLNLKLNISDTAAILSSRIKRDTASLSRRIDSVKTALTNYLPLTGGTLTGPLNGTSAIFSGTIKTGEVTYPNIDGANGYVLTTNGNGTASWAAATGGSGAGSGITEVGPISSTSTPTGAYIASNTLYLAPADADNAGIVSTETQTFAGLKTFNSDLNVNGIRVGKGAGNISTNTVTGASSLQSNTIGSDNTSFGASSLQSNTTGNNNTATGAYALTNNITGESNTANGHAALYFNTTGSYNTANGRGALYSNITGESNTANGRSALLYNTTGSSNTAIGQGTLSTNTTGTLNTAVGYNAGVASNNLTNATAIGASAIVNASNTIQLGDNRIDSVVTFGKLKLGTITYPNRDTTAGLVLTTDGSGTASWAAAPPSATMTYTLGLNAELGGYVFFVTPNGKHGLVAASIDQSSSSTWFDAQDNISNPVNHDINGKNFTDWRLPTKYELNLMSLASFYIGGFSGNDYWSSTEVEFGACNQNISSGQQFENAKSDPYSVRAIRAF